MNSTNYHLAIYPDTWETRAASTERTLLITEVKRVSCNQACCIVSFFYNIILFSSLLLLLHLALWPWFKAARHRLHEAALEQGQDWCMIREVLRRRGSSCYWGVISKWRGTIVSLEVSRSQISENLILGRDGLNFRQRYARTSSSVIGGNMTPWNVWSLTKC